MAPGSREQTDESAALAIAAAFELPGAPESAERHGRGHIHDSFAVTCGSPDGPRRFLLQRLNTHVFPDLGAVVDNVARVTAHLRAKLEGEGVTDPERRCLTLVPARDGGPCHVDTEGRTWRSYRFIEGARTHSRIGSPAQAFQAARAYARFAALLADLPGPPLAVAIPHFHDLPHRFAALEEAARRDPLGRAAQVRRELEHATRAATSLQHALTLRGADALPRRVVHNDCKLDNVMLDDVTGEGLCVIDLDTVMEGTVLADFGDLVRSGSCPAHEDERNLATLRFEPELYRALAQGYLEGGDFLTDAELEALPLAGPLLTLETGIRFLTDHLEGDVYFRVERPGQNLDRCRAQLRLLELLDEHTELAEQAFAAARAR